MEMARVKHWGLSEPAGWCPTPGMSFSAELGQAQAQVQAQEGPTGSRRKVRSFDVSLFYLLSMLCSSCQRDGRIFFQIKLEFSQFSEKDFFPSVAELRFLRASCWNEENEMLDFSITASGLIIRHSRNNCLGSSQLHFFLTVKESSIFSFPPIPS